MAMATATYGSFSYVFRHRIAQMRRTLGRGVDDDWLASESLPFSYELSDTLYASFVQASLFSRIPRPFVGQEEKGRQDIDR